MLSKKTPLQKATLTNNYVACASNYDTNTQKKDFLKTREDLEDLKTILEMRKKATRFVEGLLKPRDRVSIEFDVERRDK